MFLCFHRFCVPSIIQYRRFIKSNKVKACTMYVCCSSHPSRTVDRNFSIWWLYVCAGASRCINWQKLYWFMVFHISIWGSLELCLGGLSPTKPSHGDGTEIFVNAVRIWLISCASFLRWALSIFILNVSTLAFSAMHSEFFHVFFFCFFVVKIFHCFFGDGNFQRQNFTILAKFFLYPLFLETVQLQRRICLGLVSKAAALIQDSTIDQFFQCLVEFVYFCNFWE